MRFLLPVLFLAASSAAAFEPGSLGEPYDDYGLVQGCTDQGEVPGCTIVSFGSQYVIPEGGPTPPEVLAALKAIPPLTAVEFSGDILNVYDSYADMALSAVAPSATPYAHADRLAAMQGDWVSTDDPKSGVRVDGLIWADVYDGQEMGRSVIDIGDSCAEETTDASDILQLFTIGAADAGWLCYAILSVTPDRMELSYLARGNTLTFVREK